MANIRTSKTMYPTKNMHTEQGKGAWHRTAGVTEAELAENWARTFGLKGASTPKKRRRASR